MRLHLLRHAKSSWDDPHLADEERPLAPRGRRAAEDLRAHLARLGLVVDVVLVSPARRTRETWAAVAPGVGGDPEVRVEPDVYDASYRDLLRVLDGVAAQTVLVVGHNPGTEELVAFLTDAPVQPVPTGGFVTLDVDTWERGGARLIDFVRPRELPTT